MITKQEEFDALTGSFDFTVNATMPELEELQTKASTGVVVRLNWKEGDKLSVINLTTGKTLGGDLVAKSTGVTTEFNGTLTGTVSSSDKLLFLYPSQNFTSEEPFSEINIDFSIQSGKSGVDVCAYAIGRLGNVFVSGVSATFKFLISYLEMNLSDLERGGVVNTVKVENMGAGITITSNPTKDDILTSENNGTITLSPSTNINNTGSCAVFLSTFAASAPSRERKVVVNTSNATVAADWSAAALKVGKFYNTILTGFEEYEEPSSPDNPVPGTPIDYKVDDVVLGQSIPVIGDWDNDPGSDDTYLHWAPVNCGYEASGTPLSKDDLRIGKLYCWGEHDGGTGNWNDGQGPCPHGWRLPTEREFVVLMSGENGNYGWVNSGFCGEGNGYPGAEFFGGNEDKTAGTGVFLPGGFYSGYYYSSASNFRVIRYWSASLQSMTYAKYLSSGSSSAPSISSSSFSSSYSVRCVTDSPSTPASAHKPSFAQVVDISSKNDWSDITAVVTATISSDGGAPVMERGVLYGTSESKITSKVICSTTGAGSYQVTLPGLTGTTKYYVKAYAINSEGVSYSQVYTFNTEVTGSGFNWNAVTHSVLEPISSYSAIHWFVSNGILYCKDGGIILTVDNSGYSITANTNLSNDHRNYENWSVWTAPDGNVYGSSTEDDDPEYDDYYTIYRFENGKWVSVKSGIHYDDFYPTGQSIWKTNNYLYTRSGSSYLRSSDGYTFSVVTMSNVPVSYLSKEDVWTSATGNAYYSNGTSHYRFNESGLSWNKISTSGWPSITAKDVFVAGSVTYWVSGGDCYMFNETSSTWTKIDNDFRKGLYGRYIWTYSGKYYYSDGTVNKELKMGGKSFTTGSLLCFSKYDNSICNINGNMLWSSYLKTPGTTIWNKLNQNYTSYPIVALSISMSGQYYRLDSYWNDEDYTSTYYLHPIDPTSGICSSDYEVRGDGLTYYLAEYLWKDRDGITHYSNDKKVFNDANGVCYYCCDERGYSNNYATHYRIYDESNGWSASIPLNTPSNNLNPKCFWSDGDGNIYYTSEYTQYQLSPIE